MATWTKEEEQDLVRTVLKNSILNPQESDIEKAWNDVLTEHNKKTYDRKIDPLKKRFSELRKQNTLLKNIATTPQKKNKAIHSQATNVNDPDENTGLDAITAAAATDQGDQPKSVSNAGQLVNEDLISKILQELDIRVDRLESKLDKMNKSLSCYQLASKLQNQMEDSIRRLDELKPMMEQSVEEFSKLKKEVFSQKTQIEELEVEKNL